MMLAECLRHKANARFSWKLAVYLQASTQLLDKRVPMQHDACAHLHAQNYMRQPVRSSLH